MQWQEHDNRKEAMTRIYQQVWNGIVQLYSEGTQACELREVGFGKCFLRTMRAEQGLQEVMGMD